MRTGSQRDTEGAVVRTVRMHHRRGTFRILIAVGAVGFASAFFSACAAREEDETARLAETAEQVQIRTLLDVVDCSETDYFNSYVTDASESPIAMCGRVHGRDEDWRMISQFSTQMAVQLGGSTSPEWFCTSLNLTHFVCAVIIGETVNSGQHFLISAALETGDDPEIPSDPSTLFSTFPGEFALLVGYLDPEEDY